MSWKKIQEKNGNPASWHFFNAALSVSFRFSNFDHQIPRLWLDMKHADVQASARMRVGVFSPDTEVTSVQLRRETVWDAVRGRTGERDPVSRQVPPLDWQVSGDIREEASGLSQQAAVTVT